MGKGKREIESSDEEGSNDYQKDGFVVDSDEEIDEEVQDDQDESYDEELSAEDLALIDENQNNKKKGRLQKNVDEDQVEEEPIREDEEPDQNSAEEAIDEDEQNILINKLFDPTQREQAFLNQNDEEIIKQDVPESIQLSYMKMTNGKLLGGPREEANEQQLKWIGEKMASQFDQKDRSEVLGGIRLILDFYRKENLDVMFIYTYKRHLITNALHLEHYWQIRELDQEWENFNKFKSRIIDLIEIMPNDVQKETAFMYLNNAKELDELQNLKEYIDYVMMKIKCKQSSQSFIEQELDKLSLVQKKQLSKERIMNDYIRLRVDEAALMFCYTTDEFFSKLQGKEVQLDRRIIQSLDEIWNHLTLDFQQIDQQQYIKMLQKYLMMELFHHPFIRDFMSLKYREHLLISTEPTSLGNREITAVSYFYPVKRIKYRQYKYMEDQTWMQCLRAEQLGYIKISFSISKDKEHKQEKFPRDDIMVMLFDKFVKIDEQPKEQEKIMKIRDIVLRGILQELWYPILEKQIKLKLQNIAQKHIIKICQQKFKQLINKQPHISELGANLQMQQQTINPDVKIMSLVIGQDQTDIKTLKAYSQDCSIQKKYIGMAVIDYKGEQQTLQIFNYLTQDERRTDITEQIRKEQAVLDNFFDKYKPDLVVISANHPDCLKLRADLRKKYQQNSTVWVTLADAQISHIYSMSEKSQQQLPDIPQILKEAISLARYKLNPMAEVLNLWNDQLDKNGCLHINMHPLQSMVSQQVLQEQIQQTATEIVNQVGVDLVDCCLHKHFADQMQFINGLGRRQSKHLLTMVRGLLSKSSFGNNYEDEKLIYQKLEESKDFISLQRIDIIKTQILKKTVFKNVHGFIRINRGVQPLDITRLQNKMYPDAVHIAKCALDVGIKEDKQNTVVRQLMNQPQKMEELQLEDWAKQRELKDGSEKFTLVAQFMKEELGNPFSYKFDAQNKEMSNSEIFYAITQESPYTFRKNSVVQGTIARKMEGKDKTKDSDKFFVKLSDNGLSGTLRKEDMLSQEFCIGQIIKTYVKRIPATENNNKYDSVNILIIELSLKADWSSSEYIKPQKYDPWPYQNIQYEDYCNKVCSTFDTSKFKEQDVPVIPQDQMINKQKQQQKLILRNINHPKFKSVLLKGALEYIESQPVGEYIIRPNQRLKDHLTITWKFYEGVISHLYVQEVKQAQWEKPKLILNGKQYDSFDEIYENYITPCNSLMEAVVNNKKFNNVSMEQLEKKLREEKEKDEEIIPYGYCVTEKAPQYIVLMYIKLKNKVEKEYIKVKPEGLSFHAQMHQNLKDLTLWFKKNFRTTEYKEFVRRTKPPIIESNDRLDQLNQKWDVKREKTKEERVKHEESGYNVICSKCNKRGHNANDCRSARDKNSRPGDSKMGCHNCGQTGHIKKNCPKLNSRRDRSNSRDREKQSTRKPQQFQAKVEETPQMGW